MYEGPGVYYHYKGGMYFVLGLAEHTEEKQGEDKVVYIHLKSGKMYVRPLVNFNEKVYKWDSVEWKEGHVRFQRVSKFDSKGIAVVGSGETCLIFSPDKEKTH